MIARPLQDTHSQNRAGCQLHSLDAAINGHENAFCCAELAALFGQPATSLLCSLL
jgi:hypothetical protein